MKALIRKADESNLDFICKFKSEYYRHTMEGMVMDGPQVSNMLIDACRLPSGQSQVIMAVLGDKLSLEDTEKMLLRMYEHDHEERSSVDKDILPVLYSQAGKANHRSSGKPQRNDQYQRTNPRDRTGRLTTCLNCKSNEHWVNNCPEKRSRSCWRFSSTYHLLKDCPEFDPVGYGGFGANGTV